LIGRKREKELEKFENREREMNGIDKFIVFFSYGGLIISLPT